MHTHHHHLWLVAGVSFGLALALLAYVVYDWRKDNRPNNRNR